MQVFSGWVNFLRTSALFWENGFSMYVRLGNLRDNDIEQDFLPFLLPMALIVAAILERDQKEKDRIVSMVVQVSAPHVRGGALTSTVWQGQDLWRFGAWFWGYLSGKLNVSRHLFWKLSDLSSVGSS